MKKNLARVVCKALLECSGKLDHSVLAIERVCGEESLKSYRRRVGQILGLFYVEILRDLFQEHPELEPESMRSSAQSVASLIPDAVMRSEDPLTDASEYVNQARESLRRLRELLLASQEELPDIYHETIDGSVDMTDELLRALTTKIP